VTKFSNHQKRRKRRVNGHTTHPLGVRRLLSETSRLQTKRSAGKTRVETPGQIPEKNPVGFGGQNLSKNHKNPPEKHSKLNPILVSCFTDNEIFYYK